MRTFLVAAALVARAFADAGLEEDASIVSSVTDSIIAKPTFTVSIFESISTARSNHLLANQVKGSLPRTIHR